MADENNIDRDEALFLSIVYSFHAAAMQQMGKIANPFTGKVERDLEAARGTIDVLAMFRKKTQGNLSERERRVLTGLITELQLNYVDESKRGPAAADKEPAPGAEVAAEPRPTAAEEEGVEGAAAAENEPAGVEKPVDGEPGRKEAKKRRAPKDKKEE